MCMRPCVPYYDLRTWDSLPSTGKQLTAIQDDSGQEVAVKCYKFWSWPQQVAVLWQVSTHTSVHSIHMRGTLRSQLFLFLLASKIASCRAIDRSGSMSSSTKCWNPKPTTFCVPVSKWEYCLYIYIRMCGQKAKHLSQTLRVSDCRIIGWLAYHIISRQSRLGSWIKITSAKN